MCFLFYYLNEAPSPDEYRLVLANIRDEYWDRPTLPSGFWKDNPSCIGGIDLQAGCGGGTWLAMNREGKLAILLNILANDLKLNTRSRGSLVSDYVKNKERNIESYMNDIVEKGEQFNLFNLILFDLKLESTYYYTNQTKDSKPQRLKPGSYALSNTEILKPWKKVVVSKELFEQAVNQFPKVKDKTQLKTELFKLMDNKERYFDEDAATEFPNHDYITSYIACKNTDIRYGSRTHCVILIDSEGNCDFLEKTLETPVVADNFKWDSSYHSFKLNFDWSKQNKKE